MLLNQNTKRPLTNKQKKRIEHSKAGGNPDGNAQGRKLLWLSFPPSHLGIKKIK